MPGNIEIILFEKNRVQKEEMRLYLMEKMPFLVAQFFGYWSVNHFPVCSTVCVDNCLSYGFEKGANVPPNEESPLFACF